MKETVLYKGGASVTVLPELVDVYKSMGWEEEPKKAATAKKKAVKAESET